MRFKAHLSKQQPYRQWLTEKIIEPKPTHEFTCEIENFQENEQKFAYTKAEYVQELKPLVETGKEAIWIISLYSSFRNDVTRPSTTFL